MVSGQEPYWDDDEIVVHAYIHAVFSTKGRTGWLGDEKFRDTVYSYITAALKDMDCESYIIGGSDNHVHILMNQNPNLSIDDIINGIKKYSTEEARKTGTTDFEWQESYGAFSINTCDISEKTKYISGQEEYHNKVSFEDEFMALLDENEISYDPDDLFE